MPNRVGQQLGNYRLVRLLGQGAFAEVYLGEHLYLKSYAALKVLLTFLQGKEEERFLSEAQILALLTHPHIVRVLDYAVEQGTPVLVMDYAPSGTLRQRHPRGSCLSLETTVAYAKQVAAALQYAHNYNVIHRDVKPDNLLLGSKQNLLLGDFGLSLLAPSPEQLTRQEMAGTLPYMAPEQLLGRPCFASDQYALGILVYEWLCGVRPFEGSYWQISGQHLSASPPPLREKDPSLPQAVEDVVLKALAKDPQQRYVSVQLFAQALERASQMSERTLRYASEKTASLGSPSPPLQMTPRRVFLCASQADEAFVARLTADLELRDIAVENEDLESAPGMSDQGEAVRRAIRAAQVVFLMVSPHTYSSRTVREQLRVAGMYKRRVVGMVASGEDSLETLPLLAEASPMIDAREGRYQQALDELVACLERERSVSSPVEPLPSEPGFEPRNPYKGLRAFRPDDAGDFFGREALIQDLLKKVQEVLTPQQPHPSTERLLTVIGPSGSGKSSVVMAGLLPRLQKGALPGSEAWVYLKPMVPGTHPLEALALTLASHLPKKDVQSIREDLQDDSARGLHRLSTHLVKEPGQRVVLVIDQFEELFHLTNSEEERQRFIDLLLTAMMEPQGPVMVMLTLRADFYDRPLSYPELGQLILKHQSVVLPMGIQDLRAAITQPAALPDVRLTFEGSLVGDLLFEVQGQIGALPLLQFTLEQLFARRQGHLLTLQAYSEIGGVKGALARKAEDTYLALSSEEHRQLARALFLRLIDPGRTEQDTTRRRAPLAEFSLSTSRETEMAHQVIAAFLTGRLLTTDESAGTPTIEVSHEALIREWPRLADWLHAAREDIHQQQTLSKDVTEWEQHGQPKDRLYRGSQLKDAQGWAKRNVPSEKEVSFLQASAAQRTLSLARLIVIMLLLVSSTGIAGWFYLTRPPSPTLVTTLQDGVVGSLRWCITNAPSGSVISFAQGLNGTIKLTEGDLSFPGGKRLTIVGPGANQLTISGVDALFHVTYGATVNISGLSFKNSRTLIHSFLYNEGTLTVTNSIISDNKTIAVVTSFSGGIENRGGILTVTHSTISNNSSSSSGGDSAGGGIWNQQDATLTVTNSTFSNNSASSRRGYSEGGGIANEGKLTVINSTFSGNSVSGSSGDSVGGGISNLGIGTVIVTESTFSENSASTSSGDSFGGGIYNLGTLIVTDSTFSGNSASGKQGGQGGGIDNEGKLTVTNSTFSNNAASGGNDYGGGGISSTSLKGSSTSSTLIRFCTFNGNTSSTGGGIWVDPTGSNATTISSSIVAANSAQQGPDISGTLTSGGYNLIENFVGAKGLNATTDRQVTLATLKLDSLLRNNGGPTQTLALLPGSSAIDAVPAQACRITFTEVSGHLVTITTDQRGHPRPDGSEETCDIGAYESSY